MTITRRFTPLARFAPLGRAIHEIRLTDDGKAIYWLQPPAGSEAPHVEVVFSGGHTEQDFEAAVSRGELYELPLPLP